MTGSEGFPEVDGKEGVTLPPHAPWRRKDVLFSDPSYLSCQGQFSEDVADIDIAARWPLNKIEDVPTFSAAIRKQQQIEGEGG